MVPNALSIAYRIGKYYMEKTDSGNGGANCLLKDAVRRINQSWLVRHLNLTDHSKPALFRQGYLLITIEEKSGGGSRAVDVIKEVA